MKMALSVVLVLGLFLGPATGFTGEQEFQSGKVLSVVKLAAQGSGPGNSDTVVNNPTSSFNVVVRLGNKDYTCFYQTVAGSDLQAWLPGQEVNVRVKGKVMYVRSSVGCVTKAHIKKVVPANGDAPAEHAP